MSNAPSLAGRAVLAVALMIGFYVLALSLAALLLWIPFAEIVFMNRLHLQLALACVAGAGIILWSVWPRPESFDPPGPSLEREAHPQLFGLIDDVATATGQLPPEEVYLVHDVNAWVSSRGGTMGAGSRRIMGLGLPLLQTLSVSELRAVLAHEFGHYHGGDVSLGPWIYKTRAAIGRTLQGLEQHSGLLQKPFEWYGLLFLRVTHAISRAQEYAADALAGEVAGVRPMKSALRRIQGVAAAYDAYWRNEFEPVLAAGFRPPLVAGLKHFLSAAPVAGAMTDFVRKAEAEGDTSIYDTHPPLRDRLAALDALPESAAVLDDRPAIELLEHAQALEQALLDRMISAELVDVPWEEVGARVLFPQWQLGLEQEEAAFAGMTAGDLAERAEDLGAFTESLSGRPQGAPPRIQEGYARWLAAGALAAMFVRRGGSLRSLPGEQVTVTAAAGEVEPFAWANDLGPDGLDPDAWRERCRRYGVEHELLVEPGSPNRSDSPPP